MICITCIPWAQSLYYTMLLYPKLCYTTLKPIYCPAIRSPAPDLVFFKLMLPRVFTDWYQMVSGSVWPLARAVFLERGRRAKTHVSRWSRSQASDRWPELFRHGSIEQPTTKHAIIRWRRNHRCIDPCIADMYFRHMLFVYTEVSVWLHPCCPRAGSCPCSVPVFSMSLKTPCPQDPPFQSPCITSHAVRVGRFAGSTRADSYL